MEFVYFNSLIGETNSPEFGYFRWDRKTLNIYSRPKQKKINNNKKKKKKKEKVTY